VSPCAARWEQVLAKIDASPYAWFAIRQVQRLHKFMMSVAEVPRERRTEVKARFRTRFQEEKRRKRRRSTPIQLIGLEFSREIPIERKGKEKHGCVHTIGAHDNSLGFQSA
jgi:hypothetical protein